MASPARRTVLFANLSPGWGGGETWHLQMARGLAQRGWSVAVLARRRGALAERCRQAHVPCWEVRLSPLSWLLVWPLRALRQGLLERRPLAVILNGPVELKLVARAARTTGVPHVVFRRGIPQPLSSNRLNRWCLARYATRIVTNSRATLAALRSRDAGLVNRLRPVVIYNGLNPADWPTPPAREPGRRIAVVGRLTPEKGVDRAIEVLPAVLERAPGTTLCIIGDGPERQRLEAQALALDVADSVAFVGAVADVQAHLAACDVLLLPSRWEGFGFVLVEAMMLNLPTVAFDVGAAGEIVVDGETGRLVPDGDMPALATALAGLLTHPVQAQRLGRNGRLRALTNFTLDKALDQLEAVLRPTREDA